VVECLEAYDMKVNRLEKQFITQSFETTKHLPHCYVRVKKKG